VKGLDEAWDTIVKLDYVHKYYGTGATRVHALRGVDLKIRRGEFVVVIGPSGSGKTTLLNVIGGVERPSSGRVVVDDVDITGLGEAELTDFRRRKVGFVFQFFNLVPSLTALENVMLALELRGLKGKKAESEASRLLSMVGLEDRAEHFPWELSGGEQQRVAVARALAKDPVLLLCDEPTGELDVASGRLVLSTIRDACVRRSVTVILVTHNTVIGKIASRILRIRDGMIVDDWRVENPLKVKELTW